MTNQQLYFAIGIPILFNASLITLVVALFSARFGGVDKRFDAIDKRLDDSATYGALSFGAWKKCSTRD